MDTTECRIKCSKNDEDHILNAINKIINLRQCVIQVDRQQNEILITIDGVKDDEVLAVRDAARNNGAIDIDFDDLDLQ